MGENDHMPMKMKQTHKNYSITFKKTKQLENIFGIIFKSKTSIIKVSGHANVRYHERWHYTGLKIAIIRASARASTRALKLN